MRELTFFELALVSGGDGTCEGDGEEADVCITHPPYTPPSFPPSYPPPPSEPPPSSGGGGDPSTPTPCFFTHMNAAADDMKDLTNAKPFVSSKEYLSAVYKDASGNVQTFGPVEGVPVGLTGSIWTFPGFDANFMSATGLGLNSIVGTVHNHPYSTFGHEPGLSRYPSENDWIAATRDVEINGANPAAFMLYVIDTTGAMRAFPYTSKEFFMSLHPDSKRLGLLLPGTIDDPTTCG